MPILVTGSHTENGSTHAVAFLLLYSFARSSFIASFGSSIKTFFLSSLSVGAVASAARCRWNDASARSRLAGKCCASSKRASVRSLLSLVSSFFTEFSSFFIESRQPWSDCPAPDDCLSGLILSVMKSAIWTTSITCVCVHSITFVSPVRKSSGTPTPPITSRCRFCARPRESFDGPVYSERLSTTLPSFFTDGSFTSHSSRYARVDDAKQSRIAAQVLP